MGCRGRLEAIFAFEEATLRLVDVVIARAIHAYEGVAHDDTCGHYHDLRLGWRREK